MEIGNMNNTESFTDLGVDKWDTGDGPPKCAKPAPDNDDLKINIGPPPCNNCQLAHTCKVNQWACMSYYDYVTFNTEFPDREPSQAIFARCYPETDDKQALNR